MRNSATITTMPQQKFQLLSWLKISFPLFLNSVPKTPTMYFVQRGFAFHYSLTRFRFVDRMQKEEKRGVDHQTEINLSALSKRHKLLMNATKRTCILTERDNKEIVNMLIGTHTHTHCLYAIFDKIHWNPVCMRRHTHLKRVFHAKQHKNFNCFKFFCFSNSDEVRSENQAFNFNFETVPRIYRLTESAKKKKSTLEYHEKIVDL